MLFYLFVSHFPHDVIHNAVHLNYIP